MVWFFVLYVLIVPYGTACWIASQSAVPSRLVLTVSLLAPLGVGGVSLVPFWLGLLGVPFGPWSIAIGFGLLMAPGWLFAARDGVLAPQLTGRFPWIALGVIGVVVSAVILNAVLWPFYRSDALGIYVPFAVELSESGALVPINEARSLYELYPQAMSFTYAAVFDVSGWANPYPSRVLNALMSLSVIPAAYVLARVVHPERHSVAVVSAILVALTPDVGNWASAGYVDLPMAAVYTLSVAFAVAASRDGTQIDMAFSGVMIGLALWTKNAALVGASLWLIYVMYCLILKQLRLNHVMLAFVLVAGIAGPWYLRNLLLAGALTPDTVWTDAAQQTLAEILVLVTRPQNYGLSGFIMLAGVVWSVLQRRALVLLWWSVPYYVAWLLFASYDPRFILLFLPVLAVIGADLLVWLDARLGRWQPPIRLISMGIAAVLAVSVAYGSVEYKRALLENPMPTHAEKIEIVR